MALLVLSCKRTEVRCNQPLLHFLQPSVFWFRVLASCSVACLCCYALFASEFVSNVMKNSIWCRLKNLRAFEGCTHAKQRLRIRRRFHWFIFSSDCFDLFWRPCLHQHLEETLWRSFIGDKQAWACSLRMQSKLTMRSTTMNGRSLLLVRARIEKGCGRVWYQNVKALFRHAQECPQNKLLAERLPRQIRKWHNVFNRRWACLHGAAPTTIKRAERCKCSQVSHIVLVEPIRA